MGKVEKIKYGSVYKCDTVRSILNGLYGFYDGNDIYGIEIFEENYYLVDICIAEKQIPDAEEVVIFLFESEKEIEEDNKIVLSLERIYDKCNFVMEKHAYIGLGVERNIREMYSVMTGEIGQRKKTILFDNADYVVEEKDGKLKLELDESYIPEEAEYN